MHFIWPDFAHCIIISKYCWTTTLYNIGESTSVTILDEVVSLVVHITPVSQLLHSVSSFEFYLFIFFRLKEKKGFSLFSFVPSTRILLFINFSYR